MLGLWLRHFPGKSWLRGPNISTPTSKNMADVPLLNYPKWHHLQPLKMSVLWAHDQNREQSQPKAGLDVSTPKASLGTCIFKKNYIYTVRVCVCVSVSTKAVDTAGWLTACDSSLSVWYQSKLNDFFLMTGRLIVSLFSPRFQTDVLVKH